MKSALLIANAFFSLVACLSLVAPQLAAGQESDLSKKIIPSIVLDQVPLDDAIKNLARQAQFPNYIIDSRVNVANMVSKRWENVTATQALESLAQDQKLVMVTNSVTSVIRIAPASANVKPIPASALGSDTNRPMPSISMTDVPLEVAIQNLARQAIARVEVDSNVRSGIAGTQANFQWRNLTAKQALLALLDNYDLIMVPDSNSPIAKIVAKESGEKAK